MKYLDDRYEGFQTVLVSSLQDELLLSEGEYMLIKREVCAAMDRVQCPTEISYKLFSSLISLHI